MINFIPIVFIISEIQLTILGALFLGLLAFEEIPTLIANSKQTAVKVSLKSNPSKLK